LSQIWKKAISNNKKGRSKQKKCEHRTQNMIENKERKAQERIVNIGPQKMARLLVGSYMKVHYVKCNIST
jgi:hypothetical protein